MPGFFVEAGGRHGPPLGSDAGGERLSFLPVGGYSRDIPSDTDSDEREDFQMPAPDEEAYDSAQKRMGATLVAELWEKERQEEERLGAECAQNSCVVRQKLCELNKDLDYRNKLYLG